MDAVANPRSKLSRPQAVQVARRGLAQVGEMTGKTPEHVVALRHDDDVWVLEVDVVDTRRIPGTTDIMATFVVRLDDDGEVLDLHRTRRYVRAWIGDQD